MKDISVLIGGKAGDGINSAGALVAQLLNSLGYSIYLYFDYPSLIRGGITLLSYAVLKRIPGPAGILLISSWHSIMRLSNGTGTPPDRIRPSFTIRIW